MGDVTLPVINAPEGAINYKGDRALKTKSNSQRTSERASKGSKGARPGSARYQAVMAEVLAKLSERLHPEPAQATGEAHGDVPGPNLGRLTVGVDLGDKWSNYCILDLGGETLAEGQLRTTREDVTRVPER
jgi:hypothetical protein